MRGAERVTAIDLLGQGEIWVDSQGTTHKIAEMELRYVRHVRSYLLRNGRALAEQAYNRIAFGMQPSGDMASDAFNAILEELLDAIERPGPWLERSELMRAFDNRLNPPATKGEEEQMTYIESARKILVEKLKGLMSDGPLMDLYLALVFTKGEETTLEDVHDVWAIHKSRVRPDHWYIVPFDDLEQTVQEMDREFVDAIVATARELNVG